MITNSNGLSLGVSSKLAADVFASLQSPAFWLSTNEQNWLIFNPHLFGEASVWTSVTLKFFILEVTLTFKLIGFKFSPLDFQVAKDLGNSTRYCSSVGYFREVFDLKLEI